MNYKVISPKNHALIDYALTGSLLLLPGVLKLNKTTKNIFLAEAATLLAYVLLTRQPLSVKGLIPLQTHKKVDFFNVALFAVQSLLSTFRKNKKALAFNLAFTVLAGVTVLLTNWKDGE